MATSTGTASTAASGTRRVAARNAGRSTKPQRPPVRLCSIRFAMLPSARPRKRSQAKRYELMRKRGQSNFRETKGSCSSYRKIALTPFSFEVLDARVLRELQRADVGDD